MGVAAASFASQFNLISGGVKGGVEIVVVYSVFYWKIYEKFGACANSQYKAFPPSEGGAGSRLGCVVLHASARLDNVIEPAVLHRDVAYREFLNAIKFRNYYTLSIKIQKISTEAIFMYCNNTTEHYTFYLTVL